ncbi:MAG TPA: hypothetical protein VMK84_23900 [Streptosporangiaceae bacterium]|nr:hypothetical protein [Streptosporangiaceae bacterium]
MTSGPPVYPQPGPAAARLLPRAGGRAGAGNPGGPSGGGGWHSSAGIYYPQQTSAASGNLGPFPDVNAPAVYGTVLVSNDVWNPIAGWQQTTYAASFENFITISDIPAGNGPVVSYPSAGINPMNDPVNHALPLYIKNLTGWTSTFNEIQPRTTGIASEAGYDNWYNNYANEVMFQVDMVDPSALRGGFPTIDQATFGGTGGVPAHLWNLTVSGTEIIWQLADSGVINTPTSVNGGIQSGTVDVRAMINWLADRGYLKFDLFTTTSTAAGFGWEICSTNGQPALYRMNGLSFDFAYSPMATSPGLELSGFATPALGAQDTVNSVTVSVTEYQSDLGAQPCTIQLWDFSGAGTQVGPTKIGARSTSNANVSQVTFYGGVTPATLPALRVRVYGNAATTLAENVGGVALTVNYTLGTAPQPPLAPAIVNRVAAVPARIG